MNIFRDSSKIFFVRIIKFFITIISVFLIAKFWHTSGEGLYSLITSAVLFMVTASGFGVDFAILNFYKKEGYKKILESSIFFHSFIIAPIIFLSFFIIKSVFIQDIVFTGLDYFMILLTIVSATFFKLYQAYLLSSHSVNRYLKLIILRPLFFLIFMFLFHFFIFQGLKAIIYIYSLSWITVFMISILTDPGFLMKFGFKIYLKNFKKILKFSFWIYITILIFSLNSRIIVFLMKYFGNINNTGILFIGITGCEVVFMFPMAFADILRRALSKLSTQREKFKLFRKTYSRVFWLTLALVIIGYPVYYFAVDMLGEQFLQARKIFSIMLPGALLLGVNNLADCYFQANNRPYFSTISVIISTLLLVGTGSFLIKNFSLIGASYAVLISYVISSFVDYYFIIKLEGIKNTMKIFYPKNLLKRIP